MTATAEYLDHVSRLADRGWHLVGLPAAPARDSEWLSTVADRYGTAALIAAPPGSSAPPVLAVPRRPAVIDHHLPSPVIGKPPVVIRAAGRWWAPWTWLTARRNAAHPDPKETRP